jgi:hypothetical protein
MADSSYFGTQSKSIFYANGGGKAPTTVAPLAAVVAAVAAWALRVQSQRMT